eukprot:6645873-Alexandrium_andersonii.AAC.1
MKPSNPPAPTMHHARRLCSAASSSASRASQSKAGGLGGGGRTERAFSARDPSRGLPSRELSSTLLTVDPARD